MPRKRRSTKIVIDASVARAAGETIAVSARSQHCANVLEVIKKVSHYVVLTQPIRDEWKRHQSVFARKWLASMIAHKLTVDIEVEEKTRLRNKVAASASDKEQAAMLKDFHLLEAALETDEIVISLDDKVRHCSLQCCVVSDRALGYEWLRYIGEQRALRKLAERLRRVV